MRDINRIEPFMKILTEIWLESPDLRFWQLIDNIFSAMDGDDMFFPEDYKWLEGFKIWESRTNRQPKEEMMKTIDMEYLRYSKDIVKAYNSSRKHE